MIVPIVIVSLVIVVMFLAVRYVRLLRLSALVEESWGDLKLLLARRAELIPSIADTVQQYARTEREAYRRLVEAQRRASRVVGVQARSAAEESLQASLREILEIVEAYPQLKTHDGLRHLRGELLDIEVRLRRTVTAYNKSVAMFNRSRRLPHARMIAGLAGLRREREMFGMATSPLRLLQ